MFSVRSLPSGVFFAMLAFPLAMTALAIFVGLRTRSRARLLAATPNCHVATARDGRHAFEGHAEALEGAPLLAPLTGAPERGEARTRSRSASASVAFRSAQERPQRLDALRRVARHRPEVIAGHLAEGRAAKARRQGPHRAVRGILPSRPQQHRGGAGGEGSLGARGFGEGVPAGAQARHGVRADPGGEPRRARAGAGEDRVEVDGHRRPRAEGAPADGIPAADRQRAQPRGG
jgi:hypothetical protein